MTERQPYRITGLGKGTQLFDRLPIETLQKERPLQFSLFILAFLSIQCHDGKNLHPLDANVWSVEVPDAISFQRIAGIHGKPYEKFVGDTQQLSSSSYDPNDPKDIKPIPSRFGGYCNHGAVSFPTWHRPYVMLIEQSIGETALRIANQIAALYPSEGDEWLKAANELRFPYWDWAEIEVATTGVPSVLICKEVEITVNGGATSPVPNPLSTYVFSEIPPDFEDEYNSDTNATAYFSTWGQTYRHAASSPQGGSNVEELQDTIKKNAADVRNKVARLFTFTSDEDSSKVWDEFSNHTSQSLGGAVPARGSLESVHDSLHDFIGGNGHMGYPDYAGFDPIFYLHHANVDRLLALWEWCYKDYWMGDGYHSESETKLFPWTQDRGTYYQVYNEQILPSGASGGLAPFRNGNGDYWTSEETRFLGQNEVPNLPKGYSYPLIAGVKVDHSAGPAERIRARKSIAKYYGYDPEQPDLRKTPYSQFPEPTLSRGEALPSHHRFLPHYRDFTVLVQLQEHAFNRSYNLQLYYKGTTPPEYIGSVSVFARPDRSPCKGCAIRREASTVVRGIIPIPTDLVRRLLEGNKFDEEHAGRIIKEGLIAKLVDSSGTELAASGGEDLLSGPGGPDQARRTPRHISPYEIALLSSAIAHHETDSAEPVVPIAWKHHGEVFPSGWHMSGLPEA
ncbi:Di-copper centre-containing protein [Leucogyrophana mollusca]|uniref:Di-copper centre-containing protein n=1 Tax=Leucogyrophana mollusca TaxID=85980 RepID=A0ACB8BYL3_9AGAM|nr:Di-copper centre-containing protein [Leucogyrophana mollusca]